MQVPLHLSLQPDPLKMHGVVRYIPEWVPGASFHKVALQMRESMRQLRSRRYDWVRKQMVPHTPKLLSHSILTKLTSGGGDGTSVVYY